MAKFPATDPVKEEAAARQKAEVVSLRNRRLSFADISGRVGLSTSQVHRLYHAALAEVPAAEVVQHRTEECALIDAAMRDLIEIATDRKVSERTRVEAWTSVRGWSEHRAKLLGLNAPTRSVQRVINEDALDARIAELTRGLADNDSPLQIEG